MFNGTEIKTAPKSTVALQSTYAKHQDNQKEICNIYELGGGRNQVNLIEVAFNEKRFDRTVFVITVDLSKPGSALHNLQYWINIVREASTKLFQKLQTSNPELASHVEKLVNEKWKAHEDARRVYALLVPIVIVGTKYDVLAQHESEKLKWICRAMRYFAHVNGADLVFTQMKEKGFSDFKTILSQHTFTEAKVPKL